MNDDELIATFMRVQSNQEYTVLEVAVVAWPHPHTPELRWEPFHTWSGTPSPAHVEAMQQSLLTNPRYFRECERCGRRLNHGQMHDRTTCHSCAERFLGVVY